MTAPFILATVEEMVTVSVMALFLAANLATGEEIVIVSESVRILPASLAKLSEMVIVSVNVLTTLLAAAATWIIYQNSSQNDDAT